MAEVGVARFRRELKDWLDRANDGEEVIVTDRGVPVARVTGIEATTTLERLVEEGRLSRPEAQERSDPAADQPVEVTDSVSELIVSERDARR